MKNLGLMFGFAVTTLIANDVLALDGSNEGTLTYSGKSAYSSQSEVFVRRSAQRARVSKRATTKALEDVCPTITTNFPRLLWKSESSGHIPGGDSRSGGCTFIYGLGSSARGAGRSCLPIYDSEGTQISKLGRYAGNNGRVYKERYYTGTGCSPQMTCSAVAKKARRNTGNTTVYVGTGGGTCQKIPTAIGRHGGV